MKLYVVYNGYIGFDRIHVIALAESEERAEQLGREKFKERADEIGYSDRYWTNLDVELLHDVADGEFVSEVKG